MGDVVNVNSIDHIAINVRDFATSASWYQNIFGFLVINKWDNAWLIGRGNTKLGLFAFPEATPLPNPDSYLVMKKIAFAVDGNVFVDAMNSIKSKGIPITGPQDTGIAYRFQFADPDGHLLEITTFHTDGPPPGLG